MGASVDDLEGKAVIHRDQDRLEEQAKGNFIKFNEDKCVVSNPWKQVALWEQAEGLGLAQLWG